MNDTFRHEDQLMEEETIDLLHYWRVLMRFKWDILGLGVAVTLVTVLVVLGLPDIYRSSASLLIESREAQITSIEQLYGLDNQQSEYYATQHELLRNRRLAERVIRDLRLLEHPEFMPEEGEAGESGLARFLPGFVARFLERDSGPVSPAQQQQILMASVLEAFSERLSIEPIRNTQLVNIHFESEDPELAARVANRLADAYIEENLEQRYAASQKASSYLTDRLEGLRTRLAASEQRLQDFLEEEQLVDIEGVTTLNQQQLDELTSELTEARRRRSELEAIYEQVENLRGRPMDELMTFPAILNHEAIQGVKDNMDEVEREYAELSKRYGRNHPTMIQLASRQETVESNLARQVQQVMGTIENQYRAAVQNERSTEARLNQAKIDLQEINSKSFTLNELEREVQTNRQLYDLFFTRARETDETDDFEATNALVVDPAVPAVFPSSPRRALIVMIAFAVAIMFGILLAFLRDLLDNTVKSPDDVENRLHATMLGLIPLQPITAAERKEKHALMGAIDDPQSSFAESIRTIRTGVSLSSLDKPHKLIEITSTVPNEGKTTVAINLATAMAKMKKVLLIDADLRRPSLARNIDLPPNTPGLANLVAGSAELKECIHRFKKANLDVMTAGQLSPNPLELISSNRFAELIKKLSSHYDHIILDTPPTQAVSDALIMGSMADAVVYVVKADSTSIKAVRNGMTRLQYANANIIGVVLNQLDVKKQAYYGGKDYYAGYYDSYGYSAGAKDAQQGA